MVNIRKSRKNMIVVIVTVTMSITTQARDMKLVGGEIIYRGATKLEKCDEVLSSFVQSKVSVDSSVLINNVWEKKGQFSNEKNYYKFFHDGYVIFINVTMFEKIKYQYKWELNDGELKIYHINSSSKYEDGNFEGNFITEDRIKTKEGVKDITRVDDQTIIDKYNNPKYNFSPMPLLPIRSNRIPYGQSEIKINNPTDYNIVVAIVDNDYSDYMTVTSNTWSSMGVKSSTYEIYFISSKEPGFLYKGDDITVKEQKVEIIFNVESGGNYGFKKVN